MSTAGPTERTMVWLRSLGYTVEKVEHRERGGRGFITKDFMGFADIQGLHRERLPGVLAVQATTTAHMQDRVKKIQDEPRATAWLQCGNRLWVVGWRLAGPHGSRKLWTPKVLAFVPADGQLAAVAAEVWEAVDVTDRL